MWWLLLLVLGCGDEPLLTGAVSAELGQQLCALGHPRATCEPGRQVGWSRGGFGNKDKERWVDIRVPYTLEPRKRQRKRGEEAAVYDMVIRVSLKKVDPCRVAVDVVSDEGPDPVLIDNGITSRIVGGLLCSKVGR